MQVFLEDCTGTEGGPPSTEAWKRAVYKQPPRHFAVEVLPPQKHGNAYSYGMLISPLRDSYDRNSIMSRTSDNSNGSSSSGHGSRAASTIVSALETSTTAPLTTEYEVWRRWEDCLYFQDLLEVQYGRMSREKRNRLQAGKGVKKNGLYAHEDPTRRLHRAASFESLPPGPDPKMIAKDLHEVLPRLTKKGTLFKASKETIEQRGREFKALIEALLREEDDVPSLIVELRQLREVRDFFGFWRRDQDRIEKQLAKEGGDRRTLRGRSESLGSRASSMFSGSGGMGMYFSASNLSLQLPSQAIVPEPSAKQKGKQPFMQGSKRAMSPSASNASDSTGDEPTPRRRAQTLVDAHYGSTASRSGMTSSSSGRAYQGYLSRPPATAPAGMSFAAAMAGSYSSDGASAPGSPTSTYMSRSPPASPGSFRSTHSSHIYTEAHHHNDATLKDGTGTVGKGSDVDESGAIIVSLEEGETLPFDENELFATRRSDQFMAHGIHRLQDLTIKEEDERELDDEHVYNDLSHSEYQTSDSSIGHGTRQDSVESDEELRTPASPSRVPRTVGQSFSRIGAFFRPLSVADSDTTSITDNQSLNQSERPKSPTWSTRSQTPVSSARIAAAHADALRALTGGRSMSPTSSARRLAPSDASARSSVLTVTTSGSGSGSGSTSGSTNSGYARSSDTQSSIEERPYSYQSSIASCVDIDRNLTSSPVKLHSPLLEALDGGNGQLIEQGQHNPGPQRYPHDSMCSIQTFMSGSSMDMVIPPRQYPSPSLGYGVQESDRLSFSPPNATSAIRMSHLSIASDSVRTEDGKDFLDQYFGGEASPNSLEERLSRPLSPSLDSQRGSLTRPETIGNSSRFEVPGQSYSTRIQQRPTSPGLPVSARSSVMTMDSSVSTPFSISPSIAPSVSDEVIVNAVTIKVVYGEHIVAFRIDRSMLLQDVREKLRRKLADQQNVVLPDQFALAYKPPWAWSCAGAASDRSCEAWPGTLSSVSSIGATDPGSLRILFSQRDWLDAVSSCPSASKITLHVLNRP